MQLIIIVLAAFGLGYWFARSDGYRPADATRNIGSRLRRKTEVRTDRNATGVQAEPKAENSC